jgi:uncharacterized protein (TIGR02757 family)
MIPDVVADLLSAKVEQYNRPDFIANDPISIPHLFTQKQDIEIMGFWAAVLAWGQRKTIINKCHSLIEMMDNAPYDFIINHTEADLKPFLTFKHRTFNATDTLYFLHFFQDYYKRNDSLENAFAEALTAQNTNTEAALMHFHTQFFDLENSPDRTRKHVATPTRGSSCKRLNMFLRWMVRQDDKGVDFGLWHQISPSQLVCPCDVHVDRVARKLGLIGRPKTDWKTAIELTETLKTLDPTDPVKYDFALFGLGVEGEM